MPSPSTVHPASTPSHVDTDGPSIVGTATSVREGSLRVGRTIEARAAANSTLGSAESSTAPAADEIQIPNRPRLLNPELQDLRGRVPVHDLSQAGRDMLTGEPGLPDARIILNKTRIMRWSHWVGIAKEVRRVFV